MWWYLSLQWLNAQRKAQVLTVCTERTGNRPLWSAWPAWSQGNWLINVPCQQRKGMSCLWNLTQVWAKNGFAHLRLNITLLFSSFLLCTLIFFGTALCSVLYWLLRLNLVLFLARDFSLRARLWAVLVLNHWITSCCFFLIGTFCFHGIIFCPWWNYLATPSCR